MKTTILITGLSLMLFPVSAHLGTRSAGSTIRQINVTDFGARPNDGKDDSKAISRAIDFCKSKPGLTLYFPYGQYDLKSDKALEAWQNMITSAIPGKERWMGPPPKGLEGWPADKNVVLKIEDCSNLIIDGNGSLLMVHGLCQPFKIVNYEFTENQQMPKSENFFFRQPFRPEYSDNNRLQKIRQKALSS